MIAAFVWDPDRILFEIPFIHYPITWYGCFFALGFMVGYLILRHIFTEVFKKEDVAAPKEEATLLVDRFAVVAAFSAVLGARLGYVFFYGWPYYRENLLDILKVWEGGLASHGGALMLLLGIVYFVRRQRKRFPHLSFFLLLDSLVIATAFAAFCIRLGNFMNQEITGVPTTMPWGVKFLHPMDNVPGIALHPVQLYESLFYLFLFGMLYLIWRIRGKELGSGFLSGCFFLALFSFRFLIEFFKTHQGELLSSDFPLRMGQLLSIPFILLGLALLLRRRFAKA